MVISKIDAYLVTMTPNLILPISNDGALGLLKSVTPNNNNNKKTGNDAK